VPWVDRLADAKPGDSVTYWAAIREDLIDEANQAAIAQYRVTLRAMERTARLATLPSLRLLDIAAWQTADIQSP
jgi:hypothetical protein